MSPESWQVLQSGSDSTKTLKINLLAWLQSAFTFNFRVPS